MSKYPIESQEEKFVAALYMLADLSGITEHKNVKHYIDLLAESVMRIHHDKKTGRKDDVNVPRRRFIAIFCKRYLELMDLEYGKAVSPVDAKLVGQAIATLKEIGFTEDEYLEWVFNEFLVENEALRPPSIKSVCSQHFLHSFADSKRGERVERDEGEKRKKLAIDYLARARVLVRDIEDRSVKSEITNAMKDYANNKINLGDFIRIIEKHEEKK